MSDRKLLLYIKNGSTQQCPLIIGFLNLSSNICQVSFLEPEVTKFGGWSSKFWQVSVSTGCMNS